MFEISKDELKKVFKDFYNITRFMIVLFDSERKTIYSYPENMCKFCETVRTNDTLAKKCIECDNKGFDICDETRRPYIYKCHMSVIEAIAPIYANEMNVGYLMFGQILSTENKEVRSTAKKISAKYGIDLTEKMLSEMTVADMDYINSAVNMMTMCASYLYTNEIIRNNPNLFVYQLKEYIKSHLEQDLSCETLCKQFYVSRTKLYRICSKHLGMGISEYIRVERIKKAKRLLLDTDNSISKIATSVGIYDMNYLIRMFKKDTGLSPLQYRKQAQNK